MFRFADPRSDNAFPVGSTGCRGIASVKTGQFHSADGGPAHLELLVLLEAEPAVVSYASLPDGMLDVRYWGGRVLVGILPAPGPNRSRAEASKRDHERKGRRVVLVPEERLLRRPFRDNRRLIAAASTAALEPGERLRVLEAVDETGSAALGDLVRLVGTRGAAAGILALVGNGTLRIDLRKPIDAVSIVRRFDPFD